MISKIGITGGAGYIGSKLALHLRQKGHDVRVLDNFSYSTKEVVDKLGSAGVEMIEGDMLDAQTLDRFVDGLQFIYHLAAIANVAECGKDIDKSYRINVLSTYYLLDRVKDNPDFMGFFFSSSVVAICGDPEYSPVDENHPTKVFQDYGALKRSAELFCQGFWRRHGTPVIIGRQTNVYGPSPKMKYDSVVHNFVKKAVSGENISISGTGEQKRNFIYVDDLINAYYCVLKSAEERNGALGQIFNFAGEEAAIRDIAATVVGMSESVLGRKVTVEFIEGRKEAAAADLMISVEKAKNILGWQPTHSLSEGIRETFEYINSPPE